LIIISPRELKIDPLDEVEVLFPVRPTDGAHDIEP